MASLDSTVLESLQSADQLELLNAIDTIRSQGISHYVSLPQLIVCGDQSSGKSSVLEAISGIPFPIKDTLCTRFATEVVLRKCSGTGTATVRVIPGNDGSSANDRDIPGSQSRLDSFEDLPSLIQEVRDTMEANTSKRHAFSRDILRIEITGPDQPHLTIVDLPGLIHSENKSQSAEDVALVQAMVKEYMASERSIILAIVSASNDYANQVILKLARQVDNRGERTLGIITKPDTLPAGSDRELEFIQLARNNDIHFELGWHVLRNRGYESSDHSTKERDNVERDFFNKGVWQSLPRRSVGIESLRKRLATVLLTQIKKELPSLISEIESGIRDCEDKLTRLGNGRESLEDQRMYLLKIAQSFQTMTQAAISGFYGDSFFLEDLEHGNARRLRAVVESLNRQFARFIRANGHNWEISSYGSDGSTNTFGFGPMPNQDGGAFSFLSPGAHSRSRSASNDRGGGIFSTPSKSSQQNQQTTAGRPKTNIFGGSFVSDQGTPSSIFGNTSKSNNLIPSKKVSTFSSIPGPMPRTRIQFINHVSNVFDQHRGQELPGLFNPYIVGILFRDQSRKWMDVARAHVKQVWEAAVEFIRLLMIELADKATFARAFQVLLIPMMDKKLKCMNEKLEELLRPHQRGRVATYNGDLAKILCRQEDERELLEAQKSNLAQSGDDSSNAKTGSIFAGANNAGGFTRLSGQSPDGSYRRSPNPMMDRESDACEEALDYMMAYYEVRTDSQSLYIAQ